MRVVTKRQTQSLADRETDELEGQWEARECGMELSPMRFTKVGGSGESRAVLGASTATELLTGVAVGIVGLAVIIVVDLTLGDLWLVLWGLAVAVLLRAVATGKLP